MPTFVGLTLRGEEPVSGVDEQFVKRHSKCLPKHNPGNIGYRFFAASCQDKNCVIDARQIEKITLGEFGETSQIRF